MTRRAEASHLYPDRARVAGVLAGVVDEDGGQSVDPLRRRGYRRRAAPDPVQFQGERLGARESLESPCALLGDGGDIDGT